MGLTRKEAKRRADFRYSKEIYTRVFRAPDPAIKQAEVESCVTPLWSPEMCVRMQRVRTWLGLTLEEAAHELGMSPSSLYRLEAAKKLTCDVSLLGFKTVFGVDMNYVLKGGSGEKYSHRIRVRAPKVRPQNSDPAIIRKQMDGRKKTYKERHRSWGVK